MKKRNLFLSLICSIILTIALATTTILGVIDKNKKKDDGPTAGNVSTDNSGNVSDGTGDGDKEPTPENPVEPEVPVEDGTAEHPYIITDVESFFDYMEMYGHATGKEPVMITEKVPVMVPEKTPVMTPKMEAEMVAKMVPEMVPVMIPELTPALVEKMVYSYDGNGNIRVDANGEPIMVKVYDADGNVVMTEAKDADGNIIYVQKTDADGNIVMTESKDADGNILYTEKLDADGKVVMIEAKDADGNVIMVEKLDANGKPVMKEVKDADGKPIMVEMKDADGKTVYTDKVDADGKVILTEAKDEEGNTLYTDKLDEEGKPVKVEAKDADGNTIYITKYYLTLANDIDFAGVDFITLFNQDKPFNADIDGKGFALKNISINVTLENIDKFIYQNAKNNNRYDAHIAMFGNVENAKIENMKLDNIKVEVADEIYTYIYDGKFAEEYGDAMNEITVSTLAAVATSSTIKGVEVTGTVDADAYSIYAENNVQGYNAFGGLVAVASKCVISDAKIKVNFTTAPAVEGEQKNYFVGGATGYAYYTTVKDVEAEMTVSANYEQALYIGGLIGYAYNANVENAVVTLAVGETGERKTVEKGDTINASQYTWVAGLVAIIQAESEELATTVLNANITADVDIDVVYAGVVVEIWSKATEGACVSFTDVIAKSNVNTLQAFGFVKSVANKAIVSINLSKVEADVENDAEYNIKLTGTVRLTGTPTVVAASLYSYDAIGDLANVKVVVSNAIYNQIQTIETLRCKNNGYGYGLVVKI